MRSMRSRVGVVLLALGLPLPPLPAAEGNAASIPPPRRSRRPIADSIERHVEQVLKAHRTPCVGGDAIPCFPVSLEVEGPRFSVIDGLRRLRLDDKRPAPGPPTNAEMFGQMSGPPVSGPSFDPVCVAKSAIRSFKGGSNVFYLYRFTDRDGERPLLTDRKLNPESYATRPDIHYEFLGKFSGECEALAAWRKALRETRSAAEGRRSLLSEDEPARPAADPAGP